jgi:hypothetical protein
LIRYEPSRLSKISILASSGVNSTVSVSPPTSSRLLPESYRVTVKF